MPSTEITAPYDATTPFAALADLGGYNFAVAAPQQGPPGEIREPGLETEVVREYLARRINLGRAAEILGLSRIEIEERFRRRGIPVRRGATSLDDAKAEIAAARRHP